MGAKTVWESLKSLAQDFLVASGLIWIFNIASLIYGGDAWLGLRYLLILLVPVSGITLLKIENKNPTSSDDLHKWRNRLFSFQGVALGFWLFDIITTFYTINVTGLAIELNPLGWPWGILVLLRFMGPALMFSYVLLFKMKEKISLYATLPLRLMTLGMSTMNLVSGAQNFQVFVDTAALATGIRNSLLGLIFAVNLVVALRLKE